MTQVTTKYDPANTMQAETILAEGSASNGNILSRKSYRSILSYGSAGSILSIGSVGSILSIGSAGSILGLFSAGSILSLLSAVSVLSALGYRAIGHQEQPRVAPAERRPAVWDPLSNGV